MGADILYPLIRRVSGITLRRQAAIPPQRGFLHKFGCYCEPEFSLEDDIGRYPPAEIPPWKALP